MTAPETQPDAGRVADEVEALWKVGKFGDGSTPDGMAMIFCDAWEATIAGPIEETLAAELVDTHNAALTATTAKLTSETEENAKLRARVEELEIRLGEKASLGA